MSELRTIEAGPYRIVATASAWDLVHEQEGLLASGPAYSLTDAIRHGLAALRLALHLLRR